MPIVEEWRRKTWNQRASTKSGTPIEKLHGISYGTYFALRNKQVDTVEELLELVDRMTATGDRYGLKSTQLNEIAHALEVNHVAHQINGLRYKVLRHKINLFFEEARLKDEAYLSFKEVTKQSAYDIKISNKALKILAQVANFFPASINKTQNRKIKRLSLREVSILDYRDRHHLTFKQIGDIFDVGTERARQIYKKAKSKAV